MTIEITKSDISIENLLSIEDFDRATKDRIQNSDILLVPVLEFRDKKERAFYSETSNFLKFAKNELMGYTINICENQGQEKTIDLRSADIWLPSLLISIDPLKDVVLPTIISLISNYLFYRFTNEAKDDKRQVHLQLVVHDKKRKISKCLKYDGPLSGLKELEEIDANKIFGRK